MIKRYMVTRKITVAYRHYTYAKSKAEAIERAEDYGERTNAGCACIADTVKAEVSERREDLI